MKKGLILLMALLIVSGCGFFKKKKPPPLEPTRVVLEFETSGDINPNSEGRASPLFVRVYQLKSYSVFSNADFFSLYDRDEQVLSRELVNKEEIGLKPNEKRTIYFEAGDDTQTVGLLGIFMDYERLQWKSAAGIQPNKTSVFHVYVNGTGLIIR
jgi:type VI secretion system protein VasD